VPKRLPLRTAGVVAAARPTAVAAAVAAAVCLPSACPQGFHALRYLAAPVRGLLGGPEAGLLADLEVGLTVLPLAVGLTVLSSTSLLEGVEKPKLFGCWRCRIPARSARGD
jgi:hypothetical protein